MIWLPLAKDNQVNEGTEGMGKPLDDPLKSNSSEKEVDNKSTQPPTGRE